MANSPERLVQVSVERDTPLDVLAAIRQIVPNVELVHVTGDRWWMGVVSATAAQKFSLSPLAALTGGEHFRRTLQQQGFRWLGEYTDEQVSASYLTQELNFMFGMSDAELEARYKEAERFSSGEAALDEVARVQKDLIETEGRSAYAIFMRNRRSVLITNRNAWAAEKKAAGAIQ
jgi:hypothetical protein